MAGFCYEGTAGDSIFWEMAGTVVKVDFFDADGNRLMPERKTIDDKDGFVMTMPTELVYALAYDATANGEVSMKVTLLQGAGIKRVPFERPMDVFTTNGILVRAKATSLDGLPDGIYVVGRSVYIHKVTNP